MRHYDGNSLVDMWSDNSRPTNMEFCYGCKTKYHVDDLSEDCLCADCEKESEKNREQD